MSRQDAPLLRLRGVGQRYGAVVALDGVDLDLWPGDVLALCGDNGAGKSTLVRILSGAQPPSAGTLELRGRPVRLRTPADALAQGVATIYQDLALAPRLSVAENVFMGAELTRGWGPLRRLDRGRMRREALEYLARLGVSLPDARLPVQRLSGGQRQAVAIARALRWDAQVVIMDEPTAALGVRETQGVLALVRKLRDEGRTVVLVSHDMRDVAALASRVVVLRGGRKAEDRPAAGLTPDALFHLVMGEGIR